MITKLRINKTSQKILTILGGISLIFIIITSVFLSYTYFFGNKNVKDKASTSDVRFVLNWCNLGDSRIKKVLHSYESSRSLTGDHLDAYAIEISNISIDELIKADSSNFDKWYRGDQLPPILNDAISLADSWQNEVSWFPTGARIRTSDFYVYPWTIYYHGLTPNSADIIIVEPKKKIVYYISVSM